MPAGRIRFFDPEKGFGFINGEDGERVYLHASVLPADQPNPRPGMRVEYGVAEGRRGPQAISVTFPPEAPSVRKARRRKPEEMIPVIEDLIKLMDQSSDQLRRGRYPKHSKQLAKVLRAVADDFDA